MIAESLVKAGLLQFGLFVGEEKTSLYHLSLEMLPAYPQLLQQITYLAVQALAGISLERLVAHSDCIPLGTALSLQTGIPFVYSKGRGESPVYDLVGAYDVGHPAVLLVNQIDADTMNFVKRCKSVGLEIHTVLEFVSFGEKLEGIQNLSLISFQALLHELCLNGQMSAEQAERILAGI